MGFDEFFRKAARASPFPFQRRFAEAHPAPQLVRIPTGLGKTAMAVVGWLWRRFGGNQELQAATPKRWVYCLPMRVLVEQTARSVRECISNLKTEGCFDGDGPPVHVLMGGEDQEDWDTHPEREAILVGTQDMLLSRALNRGYAASRSRWPIQFGLLHSDCLWVFDEIQLMGSGLATTSQMEAFRHKLPCDDAGQAKNGHGCKSVWMSATMQRDWLKIVDYAPHVAGLTELELMDDDHNVEEVEKRWNGRKHLTRAKAVMGQATVLAGEVREAHRSGTRTMVVVNTVERACELFQALDSAYDHGPKKGKKRKSVQDLAENTSAPATPRPTMVLLHSRFRPEDRKQHMDGALAEIKQDEPGTIVVSTQVIEAGVYVSARMLFTEPAPWASLVQRFGRCNRRGEYGDKEAQVFWIDLPDGKADAEKMAPPYDPNDLEVAAKQLQKLTDVGLNRHPLARADGTGPVRGRDVSGPTLIGRAHAPPARWSRPVSSGLPGGDPARGRQAGEQGRRREKGQP